MVLPHLSLEYLQNVASSKVFQRGRSYYASGQVSEVEQRGNWVKGWVAGSETEDYCTTLIAKPDGEIAATCTCPYDWGGWCKHEVALGLYCLNDPLKIVPKMELGDLLAPLSETMLRSLLYDLLQSQGQLVEQVEVWIRDNLDRFLELELEDDSPLILDSDSPKNTQLAPANPVPIPSPAPKVSQRPQFQSATVESTDPKTGLNPDGPLSIADRQTINLARQNLLEDLNQWLSEAEEGGEVGRVEELVEANFIEVLQLLETTGIKPENAPLALRLLEQLTATLAQQWSRLANFEHARYMVPLLDAYWAEVLLSVTLSQGEAMDWLCQLDEWQPDFQDIGFEMSGTALRRGWNEPQLVAAMAGEATELWPKEEYASYIPQLNQLYLKVLERQGNLEAYVNLAYAAGEMGEYLKGLVNLDQVEAILEQGELLATAQETLDVCQTLEQQEYGELALCLAHDRLYHLDPQDRSFAAFSHWLTALAEAQGNISLAIISSLIALPHYPNFKQYNHLKALAADHWQNLRSDFIEALRTQHNASPTVFYSHLEQKIRIFLAEGCWDDALQLMNPKPQSLYCHSLLPLVVQTVLPHRPQWVIETTQRLVKDILVRKRAAEYAQAITYLDWMHRAYLHQDQEGAWQLFRYELVTTHKRQIKFIKLFKEQDL
ncbi:MAG: SWIM zinc finger family protein [Prochlorothrix sp.]